MAKPGTSQLQASLAVNSQEGDVFSHSQVELLSAIDKCGSITGAAKHVGISYKTAWDRIDTMNNISATALVERSSGGAKGGGTLLTEFGHQVIEGFAALQEEHQAFVTQLGNSLTSIDDVARFLKHTRLRTSARNQYAGCIAKISAGDVNSEVTIQVSDTLQLTAVVTKESRKQLGIKKGDNIIALIKSSWIALGTDPAIQTSARNHLTGKVSKITKGKINSEVVLDLGDGKTICAIITNKSVQLLALKKGKVACAMFKASSVILMAA